LIRHQHFTIKGPSSQCVYLAPLWRYGASNIGLDAQTWTQKERWKKGKRKRKGEGKGREIESGRGKGRKRRCRKGMESKRKGK